ncbi:hypothetical protein L3X38_042388 [Prunus dulcis]|uniref:Uncharacterized protein n=1 Tax=Prunus dulcis TaxID=3755 RepID=A0AAD4UUU5_PRUDU|nr:hypothetical protein L3X38_042388 [Prunus dulcis]
MALVAKPTKWHGGNTLIHIAKTVPPIYMCNEHYYYSYQADHPIGYSGQYNLKVGERPSSGHTDMGKEYINEMTANEPRGKLSTLTLIQSQEENPHMVAIRSPVSPTLLEENEVGIEFESEKEVGKTTLKSNTQVDLPIENLTLVEENEPTQKGKTQKVVNIEDENIVQPKATILGCNGLQSSEKEGRSITQDAIMIDMTVGEKLDIMRPQLQVIKFIKP